MPKIRKVRIQNFRSIREVEISAKDLMVLVGDNDSGKSNVLRALNLFFNGETNPGQRLDFSHDFNRFVSVNKRAKEIRVELILDIPDSYKHTNGDFIRWTKIWRETGLVDPHDYTGFRRKKSPRGKSIVEEVTIPPKSNLHSLLNRIEFEYVPAIRSAEFFRQLRGRIYGVISQVAEEGFRVKSSDFEHAIAENVAPLIADVLSELADSTQLKLPNDLSSIFERLDFLSGDASISLDSRGDGIKGRYIPLILKFIAEKKQSLNVRGGSPYTFIWAYEEPENNLEFRRAQELAHHFRLIAQSHLAQILLTSHSPIFFNMHDTDSTLCSATYIRRLKDGHTEADAQIDTPTALDERMGVMPIIAKHIRSAELELKALKESKIEVEKLLAAQDRPAIFVEGRTDYIVYKHIIDRFIPEVTDLINIEEPPATGAGASYVADRLISWGLVQRSRPVGNRRPALGLVDRDKAGFDAQKRVEEAKLDNRLVYVRRLPQPTHLVDAAKSGFNIPVSLEESYCMDWWRHAELQGWLIERPRKAIVGDRLMEDLLSGTSSFADLIDDQDWNLIAQKCVNSDHKGTWAQWVIRLPDEDLRLNALQLIQTIQEVTKTLVP